MRLLLDTHTLLWYTLGDARLSGNAEQLILDASNEVLISPASLWEIAIKVSIGKLSIQGSFEAFIGTCLQQYGFELLPIRPTHVVRLAALPFPPGHKDPFDRLLIAQSLAEDVPVVGDDQAFDLYGITRLW